MYLCCVESLIDSDFNFSSYGHFFQSVFAPNPLQVSITFIDYFYDKYFVSYEHFNFLKLILNLYILTILYFCSKIFWNSMLY